MFKFCLMPHAVPRFPSVFRTSSLAGDHSYTMWKQRLKHTVATLAQMLGVWTVLERAQRRSWTVVCYHRVLPEAERARYFCPDLVVTPEALHAHCAVYRQHYEVVTVAEGWRRTQCGDFGAKPLLSLSFDDGYRDNFIHAAPILEEHGLRGSFYVIAGLVGTRERPWYDRVAAALPDHASARAQVEALKQLPDAERRAAVEAIVAQSTNPDTPADHDLIMDAAQLKVLVQHGHEIGAHSMTHPILTRMEETGLDAEIAGARRALSLAAGCDIAGFCYPNGSYTPAIAQTVATAGFDYALTTRQGKNRPYAAAMELARVFIHQVWLSTAGGRPSAALLRAELSLLYRWRQS